MREIYQIDISCCPFDERIEVKLINAQYNLDNGLVDEGDLDEERQGKTGQEVLADLHKLRSIEDDYVFTHGDYCLPNVLFQNNQVSGYIDLDRARMYY